MSGRPTLGDLREHLVMIDERAEGIGLHELEQLGEAGQDALAHYAIADLVGVPGVRVPAEWDALVARNASRPLALLLAATGVQLARLVEWTRMPLERLQAITAGGQDPTPRELGKVLRALALAAEREARHQARKRSAHTSIEELCTALGEAAGGEITITSAPEGS